MTNIYRSLLLVIAGASQRELARQIKHLKVENQILRSRLPVRVQVTHKERTRLVKFAARGTSSRYYGRPLKSESVARELTPSTW